MKKWEQIKVKHHYVWEYYLKRWAVKNEVCWVTKKGKIRWDSPKGMCREDGFYKVSILDDIDIDFIRFMLMKSPSSLKRWHEKNLDSFIQISNAIKLAKKLTVTDKDLLRSEEALLYNSLEDMYCKVEAGAMQAIDGLAKGDLSVIHAPESSVGLYFYLGHQVTRTKAMKDRFFKLSMESDRYPEAVKEIKILMEKNWWFLCFVFGHNLGWSIYNSRFDDKPLLVRNKSDVSFITSDSPVINVHPGNVDVANGEPPKYLDLLFPVSPEYVLMINSSSEWNYLETGADEESVVYFNSLIASKAHLSIYANNEMLIKSNKSKIGRLKT